MLDTNDILDTIRMISDENLDVRTRFFAREVILL